MSGQIRYADGEREAESTPYILDRVEQTAPSDHLVEEGGTDGDQSGLLTAIAPKKDNRVGSSDMYYPLPDLELVDETAPRAGRIPAEVRTLAQTLKADQAARNANQLDSVLDMAPPWSQEDLEGHAQADAQETVEELVLEPAEPHMVLSEPSVQELECALSGLDKVLCEAGGQDALSLTLANKLLHGDLSGIRNVMRIIGQAPEALSAVIDSISPTLQKYGVYTDVSYANSLGRSGVSLRGTLSLGTASHGYVSVNTSGGAIANSRVETSVEQDNSISICVTQDEPEQVLSQIASRLVRAVNASWHS